MSDPSLSEPVNKPAPPKWLRWIVLVLLSLAMFGNYYVYDAISPLADVLVAQLGFTNANIGLLQAIYSTPNIFMVLIGGIIIDRIGVKKATLIFSALCFLGAALTAVSGTLSMMAAGRLLFGLGAESLIVAVTTAVARWFRGKELSFAFGLNMAIARLGSLAALNSPTWAKSAYQGWQAPLLIAVVFAGVTIIAAVIYWIVESSAARRWELGQGATDKIDLREISKFGRSYWYVVALCITFYSAIFPFQTFAVKFFQDAHGATRELGGFLSSTLILCSIIGTPLFGLLVDRVGKRSVFMMAGSLLLVPVYLLMAYSQVSIYVPMAMMGVAFSLIPAVMWPSVSLLVSPKLLGTAFGLMTMIQSIGLAGFNLMIGWANDASQASATNPGGYAPGMWIFSSLGFIGFVFAYLLWRSETGVNARGLETITTRSDQPEVAAG